MEYDCGASSPAFGVVWNMRIEELEEFIAASFCRAHCVVAGSGTSAIYLALRALGLRGKSVLIPSVLCPSPLYAVIASGMKPRFVDVQLESFGLDLDDVRRRATPECKVLLAVHPFGYSLPREPLRQLAEQFGLLLVEDAAQGGWWLPPAPGSVTILSFGWEKPLSAGKGFRRANSGQSNAETPCWGGAVLTDDERFAREVRLLRDREPTVHMLTAGRCAGAVFGMPGPQMWWKPVRTFALDSVAEGLRRWPENMEARCRIAAVYERLLSHPLIRKPPSPPGPLWRYSVLLPGRFVRNRVLVRLVKLGVPAWRMYPPLHIRWGYLEGESRSLLLPNSQEIGDRILNLIIEPGMTDSDAVSFAEALLSALCDPTVFTEREDGV
ncbi:MAG: DegT/DnrJ/EryC1/StrS family aminotransferase [Armatimonadota bacterium]